MKLTTAPLITQLVSIILLPIITRLYSPEEFGEFNVVISIVSVFSVFVTFGFDQALIIPREISESKKLLKISIFSVFIVTIISIPLIYIYYLIGDINIDFVTLFFIPFLILFHGLYVSFLAFNIKKSAFSKIAFARVLSTISNKISTILYAIIFSGTKIGLLVGTLLGSIFSSFVLFSNNFFLDNKNKWSEFILLIKKYWQFPVFHVGNDFVYRLKQSLIVIFIYNFFSEELAGEYGISLLILSIPINFLGSTMNEVFYKKISFDNYNDNSNELFTRVVKFSFVFILGAFIFLSFISPKILPIVLGENWTNAGIIISILSLQYVIEFVTPQCFSLLKRENKQQFSIMFQLLFLLVSLISLYVGYKFESFYFGIILFSASNFFVGSTLVYISLKLVSQKQKLILNNFKFKFLILILFTSFIVFLFWYVDIENILLLVIISLLLTFLYYTFSFFYIKSFAEELIKIGNLFNIHLK